MTSINVTAIISCVSPSLLYLCSDHIMWGTVVVATALGTSREPTSPYKCEGYSGLIKKSPNSPNKDLTAKIQNHRLCALQVKVDIQKLNLNKL